MISDDFLKNWIHPHQKPIELKCPTCGNAEIITKVKEETLSYGVQSLTLSSMKGDFCSSCGEGIWDEESYRRFTEAQTAIVGAVKGDVSADTGLTAQ